jgi:hypothetical protein
VNPPEDLQLEHKTAAESGERPESDEPEGLAALSPALLRRVLEHSPQLIVALDSEWTLVWANPTFRSSFPHGTPGTAFADLLNDASARSLELFQGTSGRFEMELHHPASGECRSCLIELSPMAAE